jgi:hypothetical protein
LKRQPVALDIISLLGHHAQDGQTGLHVNAIYKKLVALGFSRNKYPIINIIDYLEQSGLLMTTMRGVQKEIKTLTRLGYEFVKLVNDLDEYVKSCSDLQDAIKRDFDMDNYIGNKEQRSILRSKGWTQEEIDEYDNLLLCSKHLTSDLISPYEVIDVMFIRYVSVLSKIHGNENAKTILNRIMMDKINDQLSKVEDNKSITLAQLIREKVLGFSGFMIAEYSCSRFTDTKVSNLISSLMGLLCTKDDGDLSSTELRFIANFLNRPGKRPINAMRSESFKQEFNSLLR